MKILNTTEINNVSGAAIGEDIFASIKDMVVVQVGGIINAALKKESGVDVDITPILVPLCAEISIAQLFQFDQLVQSK